MILAKDLRIGNLLAYHGQSVHVMAIDKVSAEFGYFTDSIGFERTFGSPDFPKHIPLTEEFLIRFGFEKRYEMFWRKGVIYLLMNGEKFEFRFFGADTDVFYIKPIEYVHSLQNLYFALCGEELTLNP